MISYDVENNKIRTRVFKELCKYGLKAVQKSVFWGYLTLAELEAIKRYLKQQLGKNGQGIYYTYQFQRARTELFLWSYKR